MPGAFLRRVTACSAFSVDPTRARCGMTCDRATDAMSTFVLFALVWHAHQGVGASIAIRRSRLHDSIQSPVDLMHRHPALRSIAASPFSPCSRSVARQLE